MIRIALALVGLSMASGSAAAAEVTVDAAWARASVGAGGSGAAYVTLTGHGTAARLVGVRTPAADMAMLHQDRSVNGVTQMRDLDGIDVPASGSVAMRPGSAHIMLMMLHAPLRRGDRLPLTLTFADGSELSAVALVGGPGAASAPAP